MVGTKTKLLDDESHFEQAGRRAGALLPHYGRSEAMVVRRVLCTSTLLSVKKFHDG